MPTDPRSQGRGGDGSPAGTRWLEWVGLLAGLLLVSACGSLPQAKIAKDTRPSLEMLLERVRQSRPLVVTQAADNSRWTEAFGWVQPLTQTQLDALVTRGHSPELVATTFRPADAPLVDRKTLMDWLLVQSGAKGITERRRMAAYLADPLEPGWTESWDVKPLPNRTRFTVRKRLQPTVSIAQALRNTEGDASPPLRALLSDAIRSQGLDLR